MFDHRESVREIWKYSSSNINEVITAVLNFLLFFYGTILHASKSTKSTKGTKSTKSTIIQPSKSPKTQISEQK